MKLNQRIYDYADEEYLIEKQELNNHTVEIYRLTPYTDMLNEFTAKGKFAVWCSQNGHDYRLYVEDGYYEKLKPLYQSSINQIWLDFWDACEKITTKFRNWVMPLALVVILIVFCSSFFVPNQYASLGIAVGCAAIYLIGVLIYKKIVNKKITLENAKSVAEIKKCMGEKRFERLLDDQRSYIDKYFASNDDAEVQNDDSAIDDETDKIDSAEELDADTSNDENINE